MKILVCNDDGILAPGLAALRSCVADVGDVTVVAPDTPQSAAGHAITLTHPLTAQHVKVGEGAWGFGGISVDGRPADCVRLAVRNLMETPPDLVLSGINAGANVGVNVFYSGTVAAAVEAVMCGIPAVAFSAKMTGGTADFARCSRLCRWVLDRLLAGPMSRDVVINVNIPLLKEGWPIGVRVCVQSTAGLDDRYELDVNIPGRAYRLSDTYGFFPTEHETDVTALDEGFITITPLHVDLTSRTNMAKLEEIPWGAPPA
ncbi:MAG: 5'/3'-nucleotidase SurE [Planctomycetaceae bacterium]|nr:5'/3'-nucleotidase SurE [Planctomycetaceae bacterium]